MLTAWRRNWNAVARFVFASRPVLTPPPDDGVDGPCGRNDVRREKELY